MLTATPDEGLPDVAPLRDAIEKMEQADAVVLELAATYKAFRSLGSEHDEAMIRLRRKKGRKCDDGRDQKALDLLADLALR